MSSPALRRPPLGARTVVGSLAVLLVALSLGFVLTGRLAPTALTGTSVARDATTVDELAIDGSHPVVVVERAVTARAPWAIPAIGLVFASAAAALALMVVAVTDRHPAPRPAYAGTARRVRAPPR